MEKLEYTHVTAALSLQEFLIRVLWSNMTRRNSAKGLADMAADIRKDLKVLNLPEGVEPSEQVLATHGEMLRQFELFWARMISERPADTPSAER